MEVVLLLVMSLNHNLFWWCIWMTIFWFADVIVGEQVWQLSINLQSNKVTVIGQFFLFVRQTVQWYGAATFKLKLHFLPQRSSILPCLMFCARLSQFKILSKRSNAFLTCQIQWLTSVVRFTKTTYWQLQWQNHWNSHHAQSNLPSNIITFVVKSILLWTCQMISRSSTYQSRSRLLTYSLCQLMLTVFLLYVKCWVDGDHIYYTSFPWECKNASQ